MRENWHTELVMADHGTSVVWSTAKKGHEKITKIIRRSDAKSDVVVKR